MRVTEATVTVLNAFISANARLSGAEIAAATGLMSGTLYPILHRLETEGFLVATPEAIDPREAGRPRRILYELSAASVSAAIRMVSDSRWGKFQAGGLLANG